MAQSNSSSKSGGEGGGDGGDQDAIMIVVAAAAVVMGGGGFLAGRQGVFTSVTQMLWWAIPLVSAGVLVIAGLWRFRTHMRRRKMSRGARLVQIGVPPMGRGGARPSGDEGALFWSTLHTVLAQSTTGLPRLWGPPHVSWEFLARHGETLMRMWVPEEIPVAVIERTVGAAWQGADVSSMEVSGVDDRLFGEDQKLAMRELWYEGDPVRGGAGMRSGGDTLRTLTGQFAKLTGTDAMLVQIMTRPASFSERMKDKLKKLREKEGASKSREETQPATYRIMMRVAAVGDDKRLCRERASGLAGAFAAIAPGQRRMKQDRILSRRAPRRIASRMMRNRGSLLTSQDIAQMAHLPASDTPGVERAGARLHAPPPRLPTYGKPIGRCIDGQVAFLTPEDSRYHTHIMGPTGVGKRLRVDTPIPTPDGWIAMGDLNVGDTVFDHTGNPTKVVAATEIEEAPESMSVKFSDGSEVVADAEHLWVTSVHRGSYKHMSELSTTREISETLEHTNSNGTKRWYHSISVADPLQCPEVDLPLDPYVLGAWLGDGSSGATILHTNEAEAPFFQAQLVAAGHTARVDEVPNSSSDVARVVRFDGEIVPRMGNKPGVLNRMGIYGDKHIPAEYLRASVAQRQALLQGLMDTDGSIDKRGRAEYTTKLPALRDGMMELLRSLGYKPTVNEKWVTPRESSHVAKYGTKTGPYGPYYRFSFMPHTDFPPVCMPHKVARLVEKKVSRPMSTTRQIVAVEPVEPCMMRCIQVDNPAGMYLCGEAMIPTHNSTLITAMVIADIREGRGGVVLDPKGDLVDDILRRCPPEAMDKIDVLDPRDHVTPSINLLDGDDPHQMADGITAVFARTFSDAWGPRMSEIFEAALVTLGKVLPDATLADLPRLLDDDDWRAGVTAKLDDPIGLESFWADYDKMSGSARNQAIGPVLSRLRNFIMRPNVRYLVSQPNTTISIADAFDNGRMVLVSVPKGSLGEQTSKLLGSLVVSRAWTAAMERVNVPEKDRPDCSLYIDEVHNYLSIPTSLEQMLAEARAFHMAMCMAHQSLSQLPQDMREGLGANARNKIYFRLEAGDSRQVERDVEPVVNSNDLNSLDAYMTISRLVHGGQVMDPFTVYTEPLPGADDELMEEIKRRSRERCGRPREDIEAELRARRHELDQDLGVQSDPTKAIEADPRATGDEAPPADNQVGAHSGDPEERDVTAQEDKQRIKQERPQKKDRLAGLPPEERAKREAQAERDRERARKAKENKEAKEQEKDKIA